MHRRFLGIAMTATMLALALAPGVQAEYGHEHDGYPVNVDGQTIRPYVPQDLYERHTNEALQVLAQADPLNKVAGNTLYPYYGLLTAELQRLASDHPDKVRLATVGTTRAGLDIWMLEIADFDNKERIPLADREVVYIDGGTHSNEYSGVYFVLEWAQFLLDEYDSNETAKWIVDNRHTYIVPMVNPDGSHVFGRLNALGVNINRNFPATWGTTEELPPFNYAGPYPESEPETQTIGSLFSTLRPDYAASIHCCGNLWLYPYGAEHLGDPHDHEMLAATCDIVFPDVRDACGPIWSTIYPASGSTIDEAYERAGSSAWGFEMSGRGAISLWGQPFTMDDVRDQERESWRAVMHAFLHVDEYGAKPVVTDLQVQDDYLEVTITNEGIGPLAQGTLTVAGYSVTLADTPAGATTTARIPVEADDGDNLPVEVSWKKRLHPESDWGHTTFDAIIQDGRALLPVAQARPDMSALLPAAAPADEAVSGFDDADDQDTPGLPMGFVLLALAAVAVALARRR